MIFGVGCFQENTQKNRADIKSALKERDYVDRIKCIMYNLVNQEKWEPFLQGSQERDHTLKQLIIS